MGKLVKSGMFAFLSVALATGFVGCGDDDPDYSDVTPPSVEASYSVSGRVTGMDGNALSATVSLNGTSTQTDAEGMFVFEDVAAGDYTLTAEAEGKRPKETTVSLSGSGGNAVWNVALSNEGTTVAINASGVTEANVTSETIEGNDEGAVTVDVSVPEATLPEGSSIIITPIYTMDEVGTRAVTRAAETTMLIGTNVECSDENATLGQPISLTYEIDPEMARYVTARKYENGQWVNAEYSVEGNQVVISADQLTSYALSLEVDVTSSTSSNELSFVQDAWDNLYGAENISVESASYTYSVGTEIATSATDRITAYLTEILARMAGASASAATGDYSINVTLPVGTALNVTGQQEVTTLTVSALDRSVSGRRYGDVSVNAVTYNRNHNGGGNL